MGSFLLVKWQCGGIQIPLYPIKPANKSRSPTTPPFPVSRRYKPPPTRKFIILAAVCLLFCDAWLRRCAMGDVTHILEAIDQGDPQAAEDLLPIVYDQLRRLATQKLSQEKPGQTLQATALVHEAYLRLVGSENQHWDGRGHFFAAAAEAMRRILVEIARRKQCAKHGGDRRRVNLHDVVPAPSSLSSDDLLAVNDALDRLEMTDKPAAELVKLRYFAGFSVNEAAEFLGISPRSAAYLWEFARAWLLEDLDTG